MVKLNLDIPDNFYEGEERCGYYVSPEMKRIWAIELDLLNELMTVLNNNDIKFYVFAGSMLGAVRHNGMIPWDDDIDIMLPREDYNKLVQLARDGYFKEPYFFQDHISDHGYLGGPARFMNLQTTCLAVGYLREKNGIFPGKLGIYVDVFPIDNIPDNNQENWLNELTSTAKQAWNVNLYLYRNQLQDNVEVAAMANQIKENNPDMLFQKYYNLLTESSSIPSKNVCVYSFYCRDTKTKWQFPSNLLEGQVMLPFEFLTVPVPEHYEELLSLWYGNWNEFVKGASEHEMRDIGLFIDAEVSYLHYYTDGVLDRNKVKRALMEKYNYEFKE